MRRYSSTTKTVTMTSIDLACRQEIIHAALFATKQMLLLSSLAAALVVQQPTTHLHLNPHAATSSRTSVLRLVDASLAADTSAALVPAAQSSLTIWESAWDSHTLDTLVPDLFHTTMYATLGLMGAYVTQGTEAFETQQDEEEEMWAPPRSLQQQPRDDDDDFYR